MKDFITGIVLFGFGLLILFWAIPSGVGGFGVEAPIALSASFWPGAIMTIFTALSFMLLMQGGLALIKESKHRPRSSFVIHWNMVIAILLLIPYYLFAERFGFLLTSIFAYALYALLAGERNYKSLVILAVIVPLAITVFFVYVAQVLVPLGPLKSLFS